MGNRFQRASFAAPFRALEIRAVSSVVRRASVIEDEARRAALDMLSRCGVMPASPPFPDLPPGGREACRERAEAILGRLRHHGIECRYVGGYPWLRQRGKTLPHAWVSLRVPDHGWIEFDGTRDALAPGHIVLGWGHGYDDVAPIAGNLHASGRYRLVSAVSFDPL